MRFALMEAKACLVSILRKYRFERSPDTQVRCIELFKCLFIVLQVPLQLKISLTQSPKNGIFLKVIKA